VLKRPPRRCYRTLVGVETVVFAVEAIKIALEEAASPMVVVRILRRPVLRRMIAWMRRAALRGLVVAGQTVATSLRLVKLRATALQEATVFPWEQGYVAPVRPI